MVALLWKWLIVANLFSIILSVPLEPGQPGGPWTEEEIDIVRDKVGIFPSLNNKLLETRVT